MENVYNSPGCVYGGMCLVDWYSYFTWGIVRLMWCKNLASAAPNLVLPLILSDPPARLLLSTSLVLFLVSRRMPLTSSSTPISFVERVLALQW